MIAIILATRGTVFTEVESAIEKMRKLHFLMVFRSFDKPIPDAQNYLVEQALELSPTHLLFIEEDTVPPEGALERLLAANSDIACIDYGVNGWSCVAREKTTNEVLWCGLGCTLVKRTVFDKLEKPWFRTDKSLRLNDWQWVENPYKYGGLDIWFCTQAKNTGFSITQVGGECKHLRLDELGKAETNGGLHRISEKEKITKANIVERQVNE